MGSSVCAAGYQMSQAVSENKGDLNAVKGSFLERVALPDGAKVRSLSLFANDNDGDDGAHLFLVRKLLMGGLTPQFNGYHVIAATQSEGAVLNTMRRFTDSSVTGATIDNQRFEYYLEAVNCATVEPFAAQIAFYALGVPACELLPQRSVQSGERQPF